MPHGHISDIGAPGLIGSVYDHPSEQVRVDLVLQMGLAGLRSRINGHKAHASHKALNSFAVHFIAQSPEMLAHGTAAPTGGFEILLVDLAHEDKVFLFRCTLFIVNRRAADPEQAALPLHTQPARFALNHLLSLLEF